jgi:phosphoribosylanthranilate isomerase
MKLKICGITRLEDARYAAAAGADHLGFIQHPASPRYIAPPVAKEIIGWMYGPQAVGVFVDEGADAVNRRVEEVGFHLVQLHGEESPEVCARMRCPVIKAFRVAAGDTAATLRTRMQPYDGIATYFLLDTHHTDQHGGTGQAFDWAIARTLAAEFPLFLAGGLTAANVATAVQTVRPAGIDLSSSLEQAPGIKDFDRMAAFFEVWESLKEVA